MAMTLGERMKRYELAYKRYLPRRTYTVIRVDGRAFSKMTKFNFSKPFDPRFLDAMDATAVALCEEIAGAQFAYVQSDEVSVLVTDFEKHVTEPWMGGVEAKQLSLSAACATSAFNWFARGDGVSLGPREGMFDSRLFTMSDRAEVINYFMWRQRDAVKNSISMLAGHHFPHAELEGKNSNERTEMLADEGHAWGHLRQGTRQGRLVVRRQGGWRIEEAWRIDHESMWTEVPMMGESSL